MYLGFCLHAGFAVPHSLVLLNEDTQLMVADRENSRLVIVETSNISKIVSVVKSDAFGDALYAVAAPQMFSMSITACLSVYT